MNKALVLLIALLLLSSCKTVLNNKEKLLVGDWLEEQRSNDVKEWKFSKKGIVDLYYNDKINGSFYYSVFDECPENCKKYKSKWEIENFLSLKSIKDTSKIKCYEIIFEDNGDVSLRYIPSEKDTFEILKRK